MTLYEAVAVASQGQIDRVLGVGGAAPDEALAVEIFEVVPGVVTIPTIAVACQIVQGDGPEDSDFSEGPNLGVPEGVGAIALGLTVRHPVGTQAPGLQGTGIDGCDQGLRVSAASSTTPSGWAFFFSGAVQARRAGDRLPLVVKIVVASRARHLVQFLPVEMRRHVCAAGIELTVEVSEFPPGVLEEESAPNGEQGGGQVDKKHSSEEQDGRGIVVKEQGPIRNEKP